MANCTISTMEVNDCHLQFFDSLGNLIYEFDLETIIALNNGNGILIKDDLTTLTIDNNIVVDNLELTIAELITYIQEQRVLCDCCASAPAASVTSATWGYDLLGTLFYVKQMSDGSVVYESPIGTVTAPTGDVSSVIITPATQALVSIETTGSGSVNSGYKYSIQNLTGVSGVVNFVNFGANAILTGEAIFNPSNGTFYLTPNIPYDAMGGTTFLINYTL